MLKKLLNKGVFQVLVSVFAMIAATEIKTASFWLFYQPKAPKSLIK